MKNLHIKKKLKLFLLKYISYLIYLLNNIKID